MPECDYQRKELRRGTTIIFSTRSFKANDINLCDVLSLAITGGRKIREMSSDLAKKDISEGARWKKGRLLKRTSANSTQDRSLADTDSFFIKGFHFPLLSVRDPSMKLASRHRAAKKNGTDRSPILTIFAGDLFIGNPF